MKRIRIIVLLVLCNFFWAGNYVMGKLVGPEVSPVWLTFLRWMFASCILLPLAHFWEKPDWKQVFKQWPKLVLLGLQGMVIYNLVLYTALKYTSSTNASLVSALNPGLLVLFSAMTVKEKPTLRQVLGVLLSFCGVVVILTNGNLNQLFTRTYNQGDLLMLVAILAWTGYSLLGKTLKGVPPITATAVSALVAVLLMAPFALRGNFPVLPLSPLATLGILYIAIFPSILSFVIWNQGVKELGASRCGIFLNLMPVFTAAINWVLGTPLSTYQVVGGCFVILGVSITTGIFLAGKRVSALV